MKWSDYLLPSVGYSTHNLSTTKRFSASPGILYPVWHRLMLPGDKFSIDMRHLIRTNATKAPLMGRFKVRFVTVVSNLKNYALSLEGYNRSFDWRSCVLPNIQFNFLGYYNNSAATVYSKGVLGLMAVRETSLADYLGYPRGWLPVWDNYAASQSDLNESQQPYFCHIQKSVFPFLVYYDFYRNYMVNPQEGFYPQFDSHIEWRKKSDTDSTLVPYSKSVIRMQTVTGLDFFFRSCHRLYDQVDVVNDVNTPVGFDPSTGQSRPPLPSLAVGMNEDSSMDLPHLPFRWESNPTYFSQLLVNPAPGAGLPVNTFSSYHGGLCCTMFDPDINTSWLSVSNYKTLSDVKVNATTSGSVTSTSFLDMVKASSLWQFVVGEVYGGGTYADHIYSQYGVSVRGDLNIPQVVHVYDSSVDFEDITSQSDTYNGNADPDIAGSKIGEQFGVGRGYGQSSRFTIRNIDKNYAMAMTFMWITPMVDYATGVPAESNIVRLNDIYVPAFDNYAMQPRFQEQVNSVVPVDDDLDVFDPEASYTPTVKGSLRNNVVLGYQPSWSEYKTDVNTVHGLFKNQLSYWSILRKVPPIGLSSQAATLSSYVYSAPRGSVLDADEAIGYDVPFSVVNEDNFQCQVRFDIKAVRPMRKSAIPSIK